MNKKILLVDDHPDIVKVVKARLEFNHFDVMTALTGEEGLEKAKKEKPDLIILDVMMPGMNGYEILACLRNDPCTRQTPVVMMTAKEKIEDVEHAMTLGAQEYVMKPFTAVSLLEKVRRALGEMKEAR